MNPESTKTVRELALEIQGATSVFELAGIDYCCGGGRSLSEACALVGTNVEEVLRCLREASAPDHQRAETTFETAPLSELIDHIVRKHHSFTRQECARLQAQSEKVCAVHGEKHPELLRVNCLFRELCNDLEPHMMKEEQVLFPYIRMMEAAVEQRIRLPRPSFVTVANPVRMMMLEHERAGELLREIRQVSSNYLLPRDSCVGYQSLYTALEVFEKDLHQHIHLENNVLFPRAIGIEGIYRTERLTTLTRPG